MEHRFRMNQPLPSQQTVGFLFLTVSMITCLILLINISFKIIAFQGVIFSINSLLCPLIAGLYLFILRKCTFKEQRHVLNISLIILYMHCIGVYILVNLPAAEFMHDSPVYQIVFEDIPKKFFATTISFALSFYLPHLLFFTRKNSVLSSPRQCVILALFGGLGFFAMDFYLLFSSLQFDTFTPIFLDSLMIAASLLLMTGVVYLTFVLNSSKHQKQELETRYNESTFPMYHYFLCFAVAVLLMCIACEYRIVSLTKNSMLAASCIFFPITMIISSIIGELWGYRANLKLTIVLVVTQLVFDALLMGIIAMPSPPVYNLNPFYDYMLPRRLHATSLALFITFLCNAMLLHYLKYMKGNLTSSLRIFIANITANSLLCLVDYSLLFGGIYPYEQILNLALNVWQYKLLMAVVSVPVILGLCTALRKNYPGVLTLD